MALVGDKIQIRTIYHLPQLNSGLIHMEEVNQTKKRRNM